MSPAKAASPHVQITLRVPIDWLPRADALAAALSQPGLELSRTDAMRRALAEGLEALERQHNVQKEPSPKPTKKKPLPHPSK